MMVMYMVAILFIHHASFPERCDALTLRPYCLGAETGSGNGNELRYSSEKRWHSDGGYSKALGTAAGAVSVVAGTNYVL